MKRRVLVLVSVSLLFVAGCTSGGDGGPSPSVTTGGPTQTPGPGGVTLPQSAIRFASFTFVPLLGKDAPAYAGP